MDAASFLDRNEKRAAVGYGEVEGVEAEIAVSDMADEAAVEGDATLAVADAEAQIATLKARLYDLERRYDGQPRDQGGRFSFGRGKQDLNPENFSKLAMSPACLQEWLQAKADCLKWLNSPNPKDYPTGGHKTVAGCAKGLVSMACGGNPV